MADDVAIEMARVQEARAAHEEELLALPNVVGVGVGYKESNGKTGTKLSVVVYVRRKYAAGSLRKNETVPKELEVATQVTVPPRPDGEPAGREDVAGGGAVTDVKEVGEIVAQAYTDRVRPAMPGYSIGHYAITAGTFGCMVRDACSPCRTFLLSNNHVFANSNAASLGDPIVQPGAFDGGSHSADTIARLARFVPIQFGSPERYNLVDAALASLSDARSAMASIVGIGIPTGTVEATLGMDVVKSGRTTQTTAGKVVDADATVAVNFGVGVAYFRHQILTTAMSQGGDSGSLLLRRSGREATGLLFAGSSEITVHNHIKNVELALGVDVVTA